MRLFTAIMPPQSVLEHLETAVALVRDDVLRWTSLDAWHLTLAFYGELGVGQLSDLTSRLQRAAGRHPSAELCLAGAGRFGTRALWLGCSGELDVIRRLSHSCTAAGRRAGAAHNQRRGFRAHLTLARSSDLVDLRPYVDALAGYSGPTWTVTTITLVRSHLAAGEAGRPRYEALEMFDLAG